MKAMQTPEGYWKTRWPPAADEFGRPADHGAGRLYLEALRASGRSGRDPARVARAAAWLEKATREHPGAGIPVDGPGLVRRGAAAIQRAANALAAAQRADGGWNQLDGMGSDAYATGQALYALNAAGKMPTSDAVYQKGVQYLLRSQDADGSWHVKTRSIWVQPYFESGFPYGQDQFISAAGTAWATMALSMTIDAPRLSSSN